MERLQAAIEKARQDQPGARSTRSADGGQKLEQRWNELPVLQLKSSVLKRNRIYTSEANTQEAVSFDILRTRTLRFMQQKGWTRLAVTSPTPACGKSTISLNLAFAMARQPKTRTIQIEVDMRQPSQLRLMGAQRPRDQKPELETLSGLFTGDVDFSSLAWRYGDRLAVASNGKGVRNASDLLLGAQVGGILQSIEDRYQPDVMIFDMPPMLVNDDTLAFQQHVDCALIVAAAESSTVAEIEKCERELAAQTNVLGVVLNKCRLQSADGRYGYNYAYGASS